MKIKRLPLLVASLLLSLLTLSAVSADRLKAEISWLADPAREGRYAGSNGAIASADYIAMQLKDLGCDVQMQDFGGGRRNVAGRFGSNGCMPCSVNSCQCPPTSRQYSGCSSSPAQTRSQPSDSHSAGSR